MNREKRNRYQELVEKAKDRYQKNNIGGNQESLLWCPERNEINLWTYWQGREYQRKPSVKTIFL